MTNDIKKILDGEEFVIVPPEELNLEEQKLNPLLMSDDELYDEDLDGETVKALSHALELDYIEKWKVFDQMKLVETKVSTAEKETLPLPEQIITGNDNVKVNRKNLKAE